MQINGFGLTKYNAELIDRQISTANVITSSDWLDSAASGTILKKGYDFKNIKLTFLISDEDEETAFVHISLLAAELKECEIIFDDIKYAFPCVLVGSGSPQRLKNGIFKVSFTLKNDWGYGNTISHNITISTLRDISIYDIKYYLNYKTIGRYIDCFEQSEITPLLGTKTVTIINTDIADAAQKSTSWEEFFLALGIDLNHFKPKENNTLNGYVLTGISYTPEAAVTFMSQHSELNIFYDRFSKDGIADLPTGTKYPSLVWATINKDYIIPLNIGKNLPADEVSVIVFGKITRNGSGFIFNTEKSSSYSMEYELPKLKVLGNEYEAVSSKSSGSGSVTLIEYEDISGWTIQEYSIRGFGEDSSQGSVSMNGSVIYPSLGLPVSLSSNLVLGGSTGFQISRVQVYHKDELICDAIPIAGNLKNGFVNNYDTAFYDTVTMKFLPWKNSEGTGLHPDDIMPMPTPKSNYIEE